MVDARTVAVGLDVHKSSVRLAAVRGGELVREITLPYDHERVERELRAWSGARVAYEAGPTGFGLYRHLVAAGIECEVVAPGLVPSRPGDRVKTDKRDARRLAALHAGGLLTAIFVPSRELEALRDLVRAREDARLDRMRARHRLGKFCLRHDRRMPTTCWGVTRRAWLGRQAFELPGQQQAFDELPVRGRPDRPPDPSARGRARSPGRRGAAARADRPLALCARDRHADRTGAGLRGRRLHPVQDGRAVHELRRPGPIRALLR